MATRYLYKNIRALLTSGFTDEELRILCFEEPEFRAVYENWPRGASRATFVQDLIDRAERRVQLDRLLELAQEQNPAQYKQHQPYYDGEPTEAAAPVTSSNEPKPQPVTPAPPTGTPKKAIEVFFSYAHEDEELRDQLANHLALLQRQRRITKWHDRDITGGSEWAGHIDAHLNSADIILLLVSADFIASDYCWGVEVERAMERHEAGEARVIPIVLRPVDWTDAPFGKLQALPKDAKPVTSWANRDEAFVDIARGIRRVAEELASNP